MKVLQNAVLALTLLASYASAEEQTACSGVERKLEETFKRELATYSIINNGVIMLGVNDAGELNAPGSGDAHWGETYVGLRYFRDGGWYDSTAYGCKCEGFGASATIVGGGSFYGGSNQAIGESNLAPEPLISDGISATSVAQVTTGPLKVTHEYFPSKETPNLYQAIVTLTNTSPTDTLTDLRYRRAMDWDIPPTPFSECVSIFYSDSLVPGDMEYATDDGFEGYDPRNDVSGSGLRFGCPGSCPRYDDGPADHGAVFNFLFKEEGDLSVKKTLAPGKSHSFNIFYGAAPNKFEADRATASVGAELISYGYSGHKGCTAGADGAPNVFMFGFSEINGETIYTAPPTVSPAPTTAAPTTSPTPAPTGSPTPAPTGAPTSSPTPAPTGAPTASPTAAPTASPTAAPTGAPTASPTAVPTASPTEPTGCTYDCTSCGFYSGKPDKKYKPPAGRTWNWWECAELCLLRPGCQSWTLQLENHAKDQCHLRDYIGPYLEGDDHTSGFRNEACACEINEPSKDDWKFVSVDGLLRGEAKERSCTWIGDDPIKQKNHCHLETTGPDGEPALVSDVCRCACRVYDDEGVVYDKYK